MSTFELKTHQIGKTYTQPHFFILNKGLNSGKPLSSPCPNCFVVITKKESEKNMLFQISAILQISGFYKVSLKGSVIPFISVKDCSNTLKKGCLAINKGGEKSKKHLKAIALIIKKENELKSTLKKINQLKIAYMKSTIKT
ncbi:MAG: hypothetical protein GY739_07180 [Mesoflavibacter sp.]|nr:hypothetical protein [Mesoflavibacter sp.]